MPSLLSFDAVTDRELCKLRARVQSKNKRANLGRAQRNDKLILIIINLKILLISGWGEASEIPQKVSSDLVY